MLVVTLVIDRLTRSGYPGHILFGSGLEHLPVFAGREILGTVPIHRRYRGAAADGLSAYGINDRSRTGANVGWWAILRGSVAVVCRSAHSAAAHAGHEEKCGYRKYDPDPVLEAPIHVCLLSIEAMRKAEIAVKALRQVKDRHLRRARRRNKSQRALRDLESAVSRLSRRSRSVMRSCIIGSLQARPAPMRLAQIGDRDRPYALALSYCGVDILSSGDASVPFERHAADSSPWPHSHKWQSPVHRHDRRDRSITSRS